MRLKLKERIEELTPYLTRWAACCAESSILMCYPSRWYHREDLSKCYCLGKDDTFPCPHCQNLQDWQGPQVHPALTAELVQWWRTLIVLADSIKQGSLVDEASYINARNRAAYALYALNNHQVAVEDYRGDSQVKDKPGRADSRNADLRAFLKAPTPSKPQTATANPPVGWRFVPPQDMTLPNHWTDEQRAVVARFYKPPAPAIFDDPAPALSLAPPPRRPYSEADLFRDCADHLKKVAALTATGLNVEGDVILVDPRDVAEFVALPCKAGYSFLEKTLVVKIAARDLLDRYCVGGGGGDGSTLPADPDAAAPIADWLGAALGDPSQSRGMCAQFGYSQEPELQRRRGVGPRRR